MKTTDYTVLRPLGFSGCGSTANPTAVDVLDGKVVRTRPVHFDDYYDDLESLRPWKIEKNGHVLDIGDKTYLPIYSLAYKKRTYSRNRIPFPMKRVDWDPNGDRNPQTRGKSKFERISWDEALDIVANEIKRIRDTYGRYSIFCEGDGHGENKVYSGAHGCNIALMGKIGGCTTQLRNADSWEGWYWGAKHVWGMDPVGEQMQQANIFKDIAENGNAVLFWGCDPETTPWGWAGQMASRVCYWLTDIGVKSIFIEPIANYANVVHADKWIPVLPNTDAAMQLAIAYVWMTEGTYEKEYVDTHVVGYDWFEYYVLGNEDGIPKTPEWAEEKCGVPAYTIKALARYWAKNNVSIGHGNGGSFIRSCFAHEPARLEICLLGMQALGHPGRNQFKFIEWMLFGMTSLNPLPHAEMYPSVEKAFHGGIVQATDSFIPKTLIPEAIMNPPIKWWGTTCPGYPANDQFVPHEFPINNNERIHMVWTDTPCWTTCWNGGNKFHDALRHESIETVVAQHPWMENDTMFADIILPVSTILECEDVAIDKDGGQYAMMYLCEKAVDPVVESKSDFEIVCDLAKVLETKGPEFEGLWAAISDNGRDVKQAQKDAFEGSGISRKYDFTFEDLQEKQLWLAPIREDWADVPAGMIEFYEDPEGHPLQTPTGKLEFYSTSLAYYFPDDAERPPVPHWIEESDVHKERVTSDRAKEYPFLMVSNHPHWRVHAQCDDIPWFREVETSKIRAADGYQYEPVWINPKDAEKYGIETGDVVKIFNERGTVLGGAYVTERVMPGVVSQDHGARADVIRAGAGGLDRGGANNLICPSGTTSKNAAGEVTSGFLVGIEKADPFELAEQYPDEFGRTYDAAIGLIPDSYII